ncbi:MAG: cell division protein FtsW [Candidatus Peribacteraceae bacterium]|nr:cell division protein FtsW [Candidatus Peribacteraceae bacterium]
MFRRADFLLLGIALGLSLFGLAMIASVSVYQSYQLTQRFVESGSWAAPSNAFYLWRSFVHMLVALGALGVTSIIPYHVWQRHARTLFLLNMGFLIVLFIPGIGNQYGTARSWLHLGFFSVQPSEFLKITLVFYLAVWLQKKESSIATFQEGFIPFVVLLCVSTFFVAIQPDLGSFLVFTVIATVMFFVAGGNILHLFLGAGVAGLLGLPVILNKDYIRNRFTVFLHVLFNPDDMTYREGIGFQVYQALIAIGSGGMFGVGYGKSIQKFGYLPEVQSDTIFAAMAEELGFLRLLIVLSLYGIFVYRGYRVARNAPDRFGLLVATGITTGIAFQTLLNICVNLSLFPITGLTLPFISYGGSSLLATLAGVGVLLNISMHSTEEDVSIRRRNRTEHTGALRRFIHR